MIHKHISRIALIGAIAAGTTAYGQNAVGDAIRDAAGQAVSGATQSLSNRAANAVNDALGTPGVNQGSVQQGVNAGQQTNVQPFNGTQLRQNLRSAITNDYNGYRINGQLNSDLRSYGFRPGDVVLDQNGFPIRSNDGLNQWMDSQNGSVMVRRNGQIVELRGSGNNYSSYRPASQPVRLGITMQPNTDAIVVSQVSQNSLAARAGLQTGDRIISVNGQDINDPRMLSQRINSINGQNATLVVERNGQRQEMQVQLASQQVRNGDQNWNNNSSQNQNWNGSQQDRQGLEQRVSELEEKVRELQQQLMNGNANGTADSSIQLDANANAEEVTEASTETTNSEQSETNSNESASSSQN